MHSMHLPGPRPSAPPWAAAAAAAGPGGGGGSAPTDYTKPRQITQSPDRLYKARTDYIEPRQTIQNPNVLHKAPTDYTKTQNDYKKKKYLTTHKILYICLRILNKDLTYLTRVTTNID